MFNQWIAVYPLLLYDNSFFQEHEKRDEQARRSTVWERFEIFFGILHSSFNSFLLFETIIRTVLETFDKYLFFLSITVTFHSNCSSGQFPQTVWEHLAEVYVHFFMLQSSIFMLIYDFYHSSPFSEQAKKFSHSYLRHFKCEKIHKEYFHTKTKNHL